MKIMIDPAEGWRYGFPKELPKTVNENDPEAIRAWLLREGIPPAHLEYPMRVWKEDDK